MDTLTSPTRRPPNAASPKKRRNASGGKNGGQAVADPDITTIVEKIEARQKTAMVRKGDSILDMVENGRDFSQLKAAAVHGEWEKSLKRLKYNERTAQRLMKLARSSLGEQIRTRCPDLREKLPGHLQSLIMLTKLNAEQLRELLAAKDLHRMSRPKVSAEVDKLLRTSPVATTAATGTTTAPTAVTTAAVAADTVNETQVSATLDNDIGPAAAIATTPAAVSSGANEAADAGGVVAATTTDPTNEALTSAVTSEPTSANKPDTDGEPALATTLDAVAPSASDTSKAANVGELVDAAEVTNVVGTHGSTVMEWCRRLCEQRAAGFDEIAAHHERPYRRQLAQAIAVAEQTLAEWKGAAERISDEKIGEQQ